jgi:thioredoxin 1
MRQLRPVAISLSLLPEGFRMFNRRSLLVSAISIVLTPLPAFARDSFSDAAFNAAAKSGRPVLLEFHADWCPTCRAQEKIVNALVAKPAYSNVLVLRVLFDTQKDLLKRFHVRQQSTLILFKDNKELARAVGITSSDDIASFLDVTA